MPKSTLYRFATTASTIGFAGSLLYMGISYNLDLDKREVTLYGDISEISADVLQFASNFGGVNPNANLAPVHSSPRTSYTIAINEQQHTLILDALISKVGITPVSPDAYIERNDLDELRILRDLFADLPMLDAGCEEGTVHGFCL